MTTVALQTFYIVDNHYLTEVEDGFDLVWTTYLCQPIYATVSIDGGVGVPVDINKLITLGTAPGTSDTYADVITNYLTNNTANDVVAAFIPTPDPSTGRYTNRLETIDVRATEGWTVGFINMDFPLIDATLDRIGTIDDLTVTPPSGVNPNDVLIAVDGILHQTTVVDGVIWVLDGFSTIKQTALPAVTAIITTAIGGHTVTPITADMVKLTTTDSGRRCMITSPAINTLGRATLISVDGYLQIMNETYRVRDANTVQLFVNRLDYINNFVYSPIQRFRRDAMSLTSAENPWNNGTSTVTVDQGSYNRDRKDDYLYAFAKNPTYSLETLQSDAFLIDRLTSAHSFVITLNNANLFRRDYVLINRGEQTMFENFGTDTPRGSLLYGNGYLLPYTVQSNPTIDQHLIFIDNVPHYGELYKTGMGDSMVPAPWTDIVSVPKTSTAQLIELFTGTLPE